MSDQNFFCLLTNCYTKKIPLTKRWFEISMDQDLKLTAKETVDEKTKRFHQPLPYFHKTYLL